MVVCIQQEKVQDKSFNLSCSKIYTHKRCCDTLIKSGV